jgi:hypothetical protein
VYSTKLVAVAQTLVLWSNDALSRGTASLASCSPCTFGRQCVKGDVAGPVMAKERVVVLVEELNTTKCHVQYSEILSAHPEDAREQWCHVCGCAVDRDGNAADNV